MTPKPKTNKDLRPSMPSALLFLFLAWLASVGGAPYLLLSNKAPKCVSVEAASDTTLYVFYHAPGASSISNHHCCLFLSSSLASCCGKPPFAC
jgi:hypothetical protein